MKPRRIVVGALAKKKRVLPPQVEPINLYCLNTPGQGDGAVLLDCGFFIPHEIRPKQAHPVFQTDYDALRSLSLQEVAAGLQAHGYPGIDVVISTHGHADHAGLGPELHREYNCEFWASESEGLDDLVRGGHPQVCLFGHHHARLDAEIDGVPCLGINKDPHLGCSRARVPDRQRP